jgi:hypothetical protein
MSFDNLAFLLPGHSMEDLPQVLANSAKQDFPPPLGAKHNVVFAVPFRNGIDSGKDLTFILLLGWFSPSHLEEDVTLGNGQTFSSLTGRTNGLPQ